MTRRYGENSSRRFRARAILGASLLAIGLAANAGCGSNPSYFRGDVTSVPDTSRVAVLPLVNLTTNVNAPDVVLNALVVELLATHRLNVVDPGLVEEVVQRQRLRLTDRLSLPALQAVGAALGVQYVFVGTVNEYTLVRDEQAVIPTVSIALRMVSCTTGNIVWASTHAKRGDDSETMFRLGRISSLEELTTVAAREMAETFMADKAERKREHGKSTP